MPSPEELMLKDLRDRYSSGVLNPAFWRLYESSGDESARMFAGFHERLNGHFDFLNQKAQVNNHFNAQDSRDLLDLISEVREAGEVLELVGHGFKLDDAYETALRICEDFLVPSGGSPIPDDFELVVLIKWEPAFHSLDKQYKRSLPPQTYDLKLIGSGSYANVFRYHDPEYDTPFALKRMKKGANERDTERFRREFETLKDLRSPYVVEVYRFNDDRLEYTMECCDDTLRGFISKENHQLGFATRKRIALQFLFGLNYLHGRSHLHRDVSYQNVLVKRFHGNVVMVKLSDFGLEKRADSELTRTESELRGTILDPTLKSFAEYSVGNEIYSIGFVLSFIFSGRLNIDECSGQTLKVIQKCTMQDATARYLNVLAIIRDVESLDES